MIANKHLTELVNTEQEGFIKLLKRYFPQKKYYSPRILNLFCGPVIEEPVLLDYFGPHSNITSIDNDPKMEEIAITLGRKSFVLGDVSNLQQYATGKYDIVIMRNPPIVDDDYYGEFHQLPEVLWNLYPLMHRHSTLFISLLNSHEWEIVPQMVVRSGYRNIRAEYNHYPTPNAKLATTGSDSKDNYIITADSPTWLSRLLWRAPK